MEKVKDKDIMKHELKEIRNSYDNFDSFDSILETLENLDDVKAYSSLFQNFNYKIFSKLRVVKNYVKKLISYKLNLNPMIKRFNKEKIGDRMKKRNFIQNLKFINSFERVENLKINQIAPEVFLLESLKKY